MVSQSYYELLSISPGASVEEIKRSYHALAKHNHPDLFPEEERSFHEMRMMRINEAYMAILCDRAEREADPRDDESPEVPPRETRADERAVGPLKDPAYTYYKLGFVYFSEGRRTFFKRYVEGGQRIDFVTDSFDVLRLAVSSLHFFHKAYTCFYTVAHDYPASVWARDSEIKIYYLNRYNVIYQRICNNLTRQIQEKPAKAARPGRVDALHGTT